MKFAASAFCALLISTGLVSSVVAQDGSATSPADNIVKANPPDPMPEPLCDVAAATNGTWLEGGWVAPYARFTFTKAADGVWNFTYTQKRGVSEGHKQEYTSFDGMLERVTPCTFSGQAGGKVAFEGVLTETGQIFATMSSVKVEDDSKFRRYILRRER